jgi:hypothetical protein
MNSRACVELQNLWDSSFPASKAQFNSWQVDRLAALIDNLYTLLSDTTKQRQSTRNTYVNSAVASLIRSCTSLIQISSQEFREKKANEERIKKNTQNIFSLFHTTFFLFIIKYLNNYKYVYAHIYIHKTYTFKTNKQASSHFQNSYRYAYLFFLNKIKIFVKN